VASHHGALSLVSGNNPMPINDFPKKKILFILEKMHSEFFPIPHVCPLFKMNMDIGACIQDIE
jgi:hypothetical protein